MPTPKTIGQNPLDSVIPSPESGENSGNEKIIEAEKIILRDGNGVPRIELGVSENGKALWDMKDGAGITRTSLEVAEEGDAKLLFKDENGSGRIIVNMDQKGRANLILTDKGSEIRMAFGVLTSGKCFLELFAEDGKTSLFRAP